MQIVYRRIRLFEDEPCLENKQDIGLTMLAALYDMLLFSMYNGYYEGSD